MPSKKRTKSSKRKTSTKKSINSRQGPIPAGFNSVTPYLVVNGAVEAIEFYKKAFGAAEVMRSPTPDGKILNAIMKIGDSMVMLSDEFPGSETRAPTSIGTSTVTLHIYTKDVDHLWEQALSAGATIAMPIDNMFWGERYGQLKDPFGHRWSISMRIKMSPEEMKEKREAAMAMFSQGEHPAREENQMTPGTQ